MPQPQQEQPQQVQPEQFSPGRLKPTLRDVLSMSDQPCVGLWNATASPVAMEILGASGVDLVVIDGEHGPVELQEIQTLLQVSEPYPVTPLVRVPFNDEVRIKQVLDVGAQNLVVPMVSNAAEARAAVAACRYSAGPHGRAGTRGMGAMLARSARWGAVSDYIAKADEYVSVTVQIETPEGARNVTEIATVEGVDALFVGPADLACQMGFAHDLAAAEVWAAVEDIVRAGVAAGIPVGVNAFDPAHAQRVLDCGAKFVVTSADSLFIAAGAREAVARIKG